MTVKNASKVLVLTLGVILLIIVLVVIVDFLCFGFFSFNFHEFLHPERYNISLPETERTKKDLEIIHRGKNIASLKKIMIASLARDVAGIFDKATKRIEAIGSLFGDYEVVIFENDSKDGSRKLFKDWMLRNPRVNLLECDDLGCKDCKFHTKDGYTLGAASLNRMNRMSFFRNRYIDYFCKNSNSEYLLVYDFDLDGGVSLDGILHSMGYENLWDAVFARGISRLPPLGLTPVMYDGLAYVSEKCDKKSIFSRFLELNSLPNEGFVKVKSAFNGLGIYKRKAVLSSRYHSVNKTLNCEHIGFHYDMIKNGHDKIYINNLMEIEAGPQGPDNKFLTTWQFLFC
jgi:hypothetical protein